MSTKLKIDDNTPVNGGELATYMRMGKNAISADRKKGYIFEFETHGLTTAGHYKAWLREQAAALAKQKAMASQTDQEGEAHLQRELHRLRSSAGKSRAPQSNRGSRTPSPRPAKSSGSMQPA